MPFFNTPRRLSSAINPPSSRAFLKDCTPASAWSISCAFRITGVIMASTAASAGKNFEPQRNADFAHTVVEVSEPTVVGTSGNRSQATTQGVSKNRVLIIVENQTVPFDRRVWREACPKGYEVIKGIRIYRHPSPAEGSTPKGYLWEYGCTLLWEFLYTLWIWLRHEFDVIQGCNPPDDIFLV